MGQLSLKKRKEKKRGKGEKKRKRWRWWWRRRRGRRRDKKREEKRAIGAFLDALAFDRIPPRFRLANRDVFYLEVGKSEVP